MGGVKVSRTNLYLHQTVQRTERVLTSTSDKSNVWSAKSGRCGAAYDARMFMDCAPDVGTCVRWMCGAYDDAINDSAAYRRLRRLEDARWHRAYASEMKHIIEKVCEFEGIEFATSFGRF